MRLLWGKSAVRLAPSAVAGVLLLEAPGLLKVSLIRRANAMQCSKQSEGYSYT